MLHAGQRPQTLGTNAAMTSTFHFLGRRRRPASVAEETGVVLEQHNNLCQYNNGITIAISRHLRCCLHERRY